VDENSIILKKPYIERIYTDETSSLEEIRNIITEITNDLVDYISMGKDAYELKLLKKIAQYIRENYARADFSLQKLADYLQMTPPYLSQYFKKKTNYTISEYVTKLRMRKAKELLLNTDMSISDIALQVGYYSVSSFIRRFREMENLTPGEYKKKYSAK
jgi:YesN/AraC family two-component response regulator